MNPPDAKRAVLACVGLAGVVVIVAEVGQKKTPDVVPLVVGGFVTSAVLTFMAEVAPDVATSLAVLILLAVLFARGAQFSKAATRRIKPLSKIKIPTKPGVRIA